MNYLITPTLAVRLDDYEAQVRAQFVTRIEPRLRLHTLAKVAAVHGNLVALQLPPGERVEVEVGTCVWVEVRSVE